MKRYMERPSTDFLTNLEDASRWIKHRMHIGLTFFQICGKREVRYKIVQVHADNRPMTCRSGKLSPGGGKSLWLAPMGSVKISTQLKSSV